MGTESEEEIFEAVREVEEAAKVPQKKARKKQKGQTYRAIEGRCNREVRKFYKKV
ncbi:Hypothetical predicted protein [Paramuricea clavata]|uniref:Uncharacterized protein n=1 Tax=Paramuricea clavata TaxID=317549 RepID=A0A6S7GEU6_PARCT|nr:Hypothetical predicted protein [Paramuricea clavata]